MCFKRASDRNWWSFPGFSPSFNGDATVVCLKIGYSMVLPTWCVSSCDVLCKVAIFSGFFWGIPPFQTHFDHRCACTTRNKRLLPPANGADGYAVKTIDDVTHKWNQMDRSKHCFFGNIHRKPIWFSRCPAIFTFSTSINSGPSVQRSSCWILAAHLEVPGQKPPKCEGMQLGSAPSP